MILTSEKGQKLKDFFVVAIDKDTDAFNKIMDAFSLPKKSEEEQLIRNKAVQEATREATLIPFGVLEKCLAAAELAHTVSLKGNKNSLSDSGVAGLTAAAAAEGALYNVMINLESIEDEKFKSELSTKAVIINEKVQQLANQIKKLMNEELNIK